MGGRDHSETCATCGFQRGGLNDDKCRCDDKAARGTTKHYAKKQDAMKKLPKKFQGADVVRGLGMNADKLDVFLERKALDQFDATDDMWIVLPDDALEDHVGEVKGFRSKADAIRYARACANGNVDHRVLHVTTQTLVIATQNESPIATRPRSPRWVSTRAASSSSHNAQPGPSSPDRSPIT